jgi:hypothetical protein
MLTHGKEVRQVSFLLTGLKPLTVVALPRVVGVSCKLGQVIYLPFLTLNTVEIKAFENNNLNRANSNPNPG